MRIRNAVSVIAGVLLLAVPAIAAPVKVALVLDKGGRDDKSFNAAAFEGASKAISARISEDSKMLAASCAPMLCRVHSSA